MRTHYPRTPHLPWSPGAASDDVRAGDLSGLRGREVVVTEKLDGENTTLYTDGLHARSLDSAHHPSRAWVKGLQGRIGAAIPPGWRICGENVYARHSLGYDALESWFYGFSVWDDTDHCLDWDRTVPFLRRCGVPVPPVLWRGVFDERALRALRLDPARQEGYVVRAVEGFGRAEFGGRVAKWVRRGHVQTDTHWMHAAVVANGLGPSAALWAVRSGAAAEVPELLAAVGVAPDETGGLPGAAAAERVAEVTGRLDVLGRSGDARLAGVLATALHGTRRAWLAPRLARPLGMPLARRVADLVGLYPGLHRPFPDEQRPGGLVRLAAAADLGVLHAVAGAVPPGGTDPADPADPAGPAGPPGPAAEAREQVDWSALHAEDAGLLGEAPFEPLRTGLRDALADLDPEAADRCWAAARELCARGARGRVVTVEEAVAATWRWREGRFPRLVHLVGPSGSGKSTFAARLPPGMTRISLDELRTERGSRADQRDNDAVLREALHRLDTALETARATGGGVVWDATSLNPRQRSLVHAVARGRDALTTHAVALVDETELARRNADRAHPVPPQVLDAQLRRFVPPYPGQAHRTWYLGARGTVEDTDGVLGAGPTDGGGA